MTRLISEERFSNITTVSVFLFFFILVTLLYILLPSYEMTVKRRESSRHLSVLSECFEKEPEGTVSMSESAVMTLDGLGPNPHSIPNLH